MKMGQTLFPMKAWLNFFGLPWLSIQQEDGTISEGSVFDLGVVFDATGLFGGDYEGIINIRSNDPVYPVVESRSI